MDQEGTDSFTALGIELNENELRAVLVDAGGSIKTAKEVPFDPDGNTVEQIASLVSSFESGTEKISGFGLALPGLVDVKSNRVVYSSHFTAHESIDLAADLSKATGKTISLENDANAAAYAEFAIGAGQGSNELFYVTIGKGLGGAFIFDGVLRHGVSGFAGEFGYIATDKDGVHLEDVASADGIVKRAKNRLHQDPASSLYKIGEEKITFADILSAAKEGDGLAELMLERTGKYLGIAIASVINLLNIESIVVGGELMESGDIVIDAIRETAASLSFEPGFDLVRIEKGSLGSQASAVGAAMLSMNRTG